MRRGGQKKGTAASGIGRRFVIVATALAALLLMGNPASADLPVTSSEDVTAPQVSSMSVSPLSVDVRDGSTKTFSATLTASDDLSGVAYAYAYYTNASGTRSISFYFGSYDRTSGDDKNGTYRTTASVDPDTANGTYTLSYVYVYDNVGNYRRYGQADNVAPALLTVQSNADAVAPTITGITLAPNPIDVSDGIKAFKVDVQVTDDRSGVASVSAQFTSPSGRQAAFASAWPSSTPGVATGTGTVARYSEAGDWKLTYLCAYDNAGNQACFTPYTTPTVGAKSGDLALNVISSPADGVKPTVSAYRVSPSGIDVTNSGQNVKTEFDVSDDLAGVQVAYIRFSSPRTVGASPETIERFGYAWADSIYSYQSNGNGTWTVIEDDSKRMLSGTLTAQTLFPQYDRSGDWQVVQVCVIDNVNWQNCYTPTTTPSLSSLGPTSLEVKWNRPPSVAVTGITQDSYPAGSEPTVGCDVSDVEDGTITGVQPIVSGPDAAGVVTVTCSYTDSGGRTATATKTYTLITKKSSSTTYTGAATIQYSDVATLSATLLDTSVTPNVGVSGKQLDFTLGTQQKSASPTDSAGKATTTLQVLQKSGSVSQVLTKFAGDSSYLPSSDADAFTITKEDCNLNYSGSVDVAPAAMTTLAADMGEPDSSLGNRSNKTITFTVTGVNTPQQTYTAVTDASGHASLSVALPSDAYGVSVSFAGDDYYKPCSTSQDAVVTVQAAASKVTGGGWISIGTGRANFGFNAIPEAGGLWKGQFQLRANNNKSNFHGGVVLSLTGSGNTATWNGTGYWNGQANYKYTISVVDNGSSGSKKADTISIKIISPTGTTTLYSTGGAQTLKGGNITVH